MQPPGGFSSMGGLLSGASAGMSYNNSSSNYSSPNNAYGSGAYAPAGGAMQSGYVSAGGHTHA
jgi:hypothetical protein